MRCGIEVTDRQIDQLVYELYELTDDDVIVRYEGEEVIGLTVLHASQRGEVRS